MNNEKLMEQLKRITPEEKELLEGRGEIDRAIYMESSSRVVDSRKLLEAGKLIQIRPHTRFVHFPAHTHNYVEVIYMCAGRTKHIVNGDEVCLREGELLFLGQNAVQEIMPAGEEDIAVNFIILPEFFDQTLPFMGKEDSLLRDFVVGCLQSGGEKSGYLHFRVAEILPVQNLVENLIWTIVNDQQNSRRLNQMTMGLLFMQLMNYTERAEAGAEHFEQELMMSVLRYVEEHYRDGELTELAASMNYNIYWLSRAIKRLSGRTYTELVQQKRLNQAAYLLRASRLTVADIGMAVGYDNLSYFHRIFKLRFGMSPRQYRCRQF